LLSARKLLAQIGAMDMLYKEEWLEVNEEKSRFRRARFGGLVALSLFHMKPSC
jgi:hypothetical protein